MWFLDSIPEYQFIISHGFLINMEFYWSIWPVYVDTPNDSVIVLTSYATLNRETQIIIPDKFHFFVISYVATALNLVL